MRFFRKLSTCASGVTFATALTVLAAAAAPAAAQTQPSGAGTALSKASLLTAQLGQNGSLLDLALVTDEAQAQLDSATPGSYARLGLGRVSSTVVATDAVNKVLPSFEVKSTGPTSKDITVGSLGLAPPVLNGSVQSGKLTALLENDVASAGHSVEIVDVADAVGGLLRVAAAKETLTAQSARDNTNASRNATVTDITVLDLGAVLQGLGIDLGALSVDQVVALVDGLAAYTGLDLAAGQTLDSVVDAINSSIDDLQAAIDASTASLLPGLEQTVVDTVGGLLGGTPLPLPTADVSGAPDVSAALALLNSTIDALQTELDDLLANGLKALDGVALLRLEGVEVGVATKAVSTLAASTATVTGKIGKVTVGKIEVASGLDLLGAASPLTQAVTDLNAKVSAVLGIVHSDLANLVKISVLDKATEVTSKDGYTTATAGVTALSTTLTPPGTLAAVVDAIEAQANTVADELGIVIDQLPAALGLSTTMHSLASTLSIGFGALTQPATIRVAEVLAASNYRVAATTTGAPGAPGSTPASAPELPRTGADTLFLTAVIAVVLGLVARRILLHPAPKPVKVEKQPR